MGSYLGEELVVSDGLLLVSSMEREFDTESLLVGSYTGAELITSDCKLVGLFTERKLGTKSSLLNTFEGEELVNWICVFLHTHFSTCLHPVRSFHALFQKIDYI